MAYIGVNPAKGNWRKLTDISAGFNGVTTSFTLSVPPGTSSYYVTPASPYQLFISLGGVIQQPDIDFTVSTNTITFTTAPTAGLSFFGILAGDSLSIGTPSDGTVTTSKLGSNLSFGLTGGSASTPAIYFTGDTSTGLYSPGAAQVAISTGGSGRLFVDSSGRVGIGTTSPAEKLHVAGNLYVAGGDIYIDTAKMISTSNTNPLRFGVGSSEKAQIDGSGRLLVGTSTQYSGVPGQLLHTAAAGSLTYAGLGVTTFSSSTGNQAGSIITLDKSNSNTLGTNAAVTNGDQLGIIAFRGADGGSGFRDAAYIQCCVDGTVSGGGAADMPGRLVFFTSADGTSVPTERMVIKNTGTIGVGITNPTFLYGDATGFQIGQPGYALANVSNNTCYFANRKSTDGTLIELAQDNTVEGTISVSGTTVSYNGAHLSRWSQIPGIDPHDKDARPEILRGTVMSNLDDMCDWIDPVTDEPQANEQLNKTKISDVEGDKNVAGIFQSWDDDDDTWVNDYYLAMTGDFVIRIAEGVTVERGDLLMSAGDGTAKPQDDDIIRSKTIAKVTSTNVSCTYDDGSYCVPCVLMAC